MRAIRDRRSSLLVSFSGIDGAGKTSQISNLQTHLVDAGLKVELITFWDDVATLTRFRTLAGHKLFKGDSGVGTPEKPINRKDKNVQSPLMNFLRAACYVLDAFSLRRVVSKTLRSNADVVIFDRYLYDELANLNLNNPATRVYAAYLMKLAPKPDVSFILDADPSQARARKPEYPLEFLHINRASYLALSDLLPGMTVIPPLSLDEAKLRVLQAVPCERLQIKVMNPSFPPEPKVEMRPDGQVRPSGRTLNHVV